MMNHVLNLFSLLAMLFGLWICVRKYPILKNRHFVSYARNSPFEKGTERIHTGWSAVLYGIAYLWIGFIIFGFGVQSLFDYLTEPFDMVLGFIEYFFFYALPVIIVCGLSAEVLYLIQSRRKGKHKNQP